MAQAKNFSGACVSGEIYIARSSDTMYAALRAMDAALRAMDVELEEWTVECFKAQRLSFWFGSRLLLYSEEFGDREASFQLSDLLDELIEETSTETLICDAASLDSMASLLGAAAARLRECADIQAGEVEPHEGFKAAPLAKMDF